MSLIFIALVLVFMYSHIFDGGVTYIIIFIFISERYRKYLVRNSLFMCVRNHRRFACVYQ